MRRQESPGTVAAELQRLKPRPWTATEARRVLELWRQSRRPLDTFAKAHGLVPQRLRNWRKRLATETAPLSLVPAVVVADAPRAWAPVSPAVVVHAARACTVEVADPGQVSPHWVAALVVALGTTP